MMIDEDYILEYDYDPIARLPIIEDENGEWGRILLIVKNTQNLSAETLLKYLRQDNDSRCTHSYDCCGHTYGSIAARTLTNLPNSDVWTVEYHWHLNI